MKIKDKFGLKFAILCLFYHMQSSKVSVQSLCPLWKAFERCKNIMTFVHIGSWETLVRHPTFFAAGQ